jgi:hypothetical protein
MTKEIPSQKSNDREMRFRKYLSGPMLIFRTLAIVLFCSISYSKRQILPTTRHEAVRLRSVSFEARGGQQTPHPFCIVSYGFIRVLAEAGVGSGHPRLFCPEISGKVRFLEQE